MSATPVWIPLVSALIGAIAAGLFQTIQKMIDRRNEREATLSALVMEVRAICSLMRLRRYLPNAEAILHEATDDPEFNATIIADLREDYFSVFNALSPKLGLLRPEDGARIVEFYHSCKSIKDSCHPDGVMIDNQDKSLAIENLSQFVALLNNALRVGDQVSQLSTVGQPKISQ